MKTIEESTSLRKRRDAAFTESPQCLLKHEKITEHTNPYEYLGIPQKEFTKELARKAYYRESLKVHPDRCPPDATSHEREVFTTRFQELGRIYEVLTNDEYRKYYDSTGKLPNHENVFQDEWLSHLKETFRRVSLDMLNQYKCEYVGSDEEKKDLIKSYKKHGGDMNSIMNDILFADIDQEERYRKILDGEVEKGTILSEKKYIETLCDRRKRVKRAKREKKEARQLAKDLGIDNDSAGRGDLVSLIQKNQKRTHHAVLDNIAKKYTRNKIVPEGDPIPEEDFQKIQGKMCKQKEKTVKPNSQ